MTRWQTRTRNWPPSKNNTRRKLRHRQQTLSQKSRLFSDLQKAHEGLAAQVDEAGATIKSLQAKEKLLQSQLATEKKARLETRACTGRAK